MHYTHHQTARPSRCPSCLDMLVLARRLAHERQRVQHKQILTWCLVCGEPTKVSLLDSYARSVVYLHALNEQPMEHASNSPHTEIGSWGLHWRLDEVLRVAFPVESAHDRQAPYWHYPGWYQHRESASCQVQPVTPVVYRLLRPTAAEENRALMKDKINTHPRMRVELEREVGQVWDRHQFQVEFEFLGQVGPFVLARRLADDQRGTLVCQDEPRFYWGFDTDRVI